jgi:hypothetical protein
MSSMSSLFSLTIQTKLPILSICRNRQKLCTNRASLQEPRQSRSPEYKVLIFFEMFKLGVSSRKTHGSNQCAFPETRAILVPGFATTTR